MSSNNHRSHFESPKAQSEKNLAFRAYYGYIIAALRSTPGIVAQFG